MSEDMSDSISDPEPQEAMSEDDDEFFPLPESGEKSNPPAERPLTTIEVTEWNNA